MSVTGRLRRVCIGAALLVAVVAVRPAVAATGGYPYWDYAGPGTDPATYTWTDAHGNGFSPYGYAYRNCTDYVAWKLATANGFGEYQGLGNAATWAERARSRGYRVNRTPGRGAVAWWGSELFGGFGHVAWVVKTEVGSVEVAEYNHHGNGKFDLRWIKPGEADAYIHFKDLPVALREGDFISAPGVGGDYRLVGGAPVYVDGWADFGGHHPVLLVGRTRFDDLLSVPRNGTFLGADRRPYRIAGGAAIAIGSWKRIGGRRPPIRIDAAALAGAGGPGRWSHLRKYPRDGTLLRAGPRGGFYAVRGGVPRAISSPPAGRAAAAVVVDPAAIANAGEPGIWSALR